MSEKSGDDRDLHRFGWSQIRNFLPIYIYITISLLAPVALESLFPYSVTQTTAANGCSVWR